MLREAPGHYPAEFLGALSRSRVDHAGDHPASDSGIEGGVAARRGARSAPDAPPSRIRRQCGAKKWPYSNCLRPMGAARQGRPPPASHRSSSYLAGPRGSQRRSSPWRVVRRCCARSAPKGLSDSHVTASSLMPAAPMNSRYCTRSAWPPPYNCTYWTHRLGRCTSPAGPCSRTCLGSPKPSKHACHRSRRKS